MKGLVGESDMQGNDNRLLRPYRSLNSRVKSAKLNNVYKACLNNDRMTATVLRFNVFSTPKATSSAVHSLHKPEESVSTDPTPLHEPIQHIATAVTRPYGPSFD